MLVIKKMSKKKIAVLAVILVIIIIATIFLFYRFVLRQEIIPASLPPSVPGGGGVKVRLPEEIFQDPRFLELKEYGKLPLEVGKVGRENPFEPF